MKIKLEDGRVIEEPQKSGYYVHHLKSGGVEFGVFDYSTADYKYYCVGHAANYDEARSSFKFQNRKQ